MAGEKSILTCETKGSTNFLGDGVMDVEMHDFGSD
jgi:hypothetical protein